MKLRARLTLALALVAMVPLVFATLHVVSGITGQLALDARDYRLATAEVARLTVLQLTESVRQGLERVGVALADRSTDDAGRIRAARTSLLNTTHLNTVTIYQPDGRLLNILTNSTRQALVPAPGSLPCTVRQYIQ